MIDASSGPTPDELSGAVPTDELEQLVSLDPSGGTSTVTTSSWTCITAATVTICPSNVCSSACGP